MSAAQPKSQSPMEWTEQKDILFLREVVVSDLYETRKGSPERGKAWEVIAAHLNNLTCPTFSVNKRSLRDRLNLLQTKFKAKIRDEERASGISPVQREIDTLLEEICAKEEASLTNSVSNRKKAVQDKASAEEIRKKAMESMGETLQRKQGIEGNSSKRRRSTHDALGVLEEKARLDMSLRREELELRKKEEAKSTLLAEQQNQLKQEMLKVIQQQQQEQQRQQQQQQQQHLQAMQVMLSSSNKC